jgi:Co/Zn/Cd efflux system component
MRSVWICSRNDAAGNAAVLLAAMGVFGTGTGWPDVVVAATMGGLACGADGKSSLRRAVNFAPNAPRLSLWRRNKCHEWT